MIHMKLQNLFSTKNNQIMSKSVVCCIVNDQNIKE